MIAFVLVFAGLFGLVIGSFLNVVAYRVPAGISLIRESRCPGCGAGIRWWQNVPVLSWVALRGRCASCDTPISARYPLVEAIAGVAFVTVTGWILLQTRSPGQTGGAMGIVPSGLGGGEAGASFSLDDLAVTWSSRPEVWIVLLAFLYFAAVSIVLTLIDLDTRRLPNAIVLPSIVVGVVLLGAAAAMGASAGAGTGSEGSDVGWDTMLRALAGGAILYVFYFLVRLISPRGMGGGDIKLAALVGLYLGWCGWGALVVGAFAAFLFGGIFGIVLVLFRGAGRRTAIPFGPWMIAGAWIGIALGEPLGRWYLGLLGMR